MVAYDCETWSLTLREEHRLRVVENKMLRRIFGQKRNQMIGGWRKLQNKELHDLYSLPGIIIIIKSMRMRWVGHVVRNGEKRNAYIRFDVSTAVTMKNAYRLLVGNPEGKIPLGRPRCRRLDNINMDIVEIGLGGVDWIGLARIGTSGELLRTW
jgi:hypothetical protein